MGADLEGGTQLDVHGGHEMLLLQQQQGLSVNLLRQELGGELLAACQEEGEECHSVNMDHYFGYLFEWHHQYCAAKTVRPCSEEINCETSSTLHWPGLAGRQLGAKPSVGSRGGGWWQEAEEAGERDMGSSSSSSPLESSSEWLDSERHCGDGHRRS